MANEGYMDVPSSAASAASTAGPGAWPPLPLAEWRDTCDTLHLWTQIPGKVRLALSPYVNHWWEVALYVSARGLTTSPIPYDGGIFEIMFDFIAHQLIIETSIGERKTIALEPKSVADFYAEVMEALRALGVHVKIWPQPQEIPNAIPFDQDYQHKSYDREYAHRFWRVLVSADTVLKEFRGRFIGKSSPVHFFWGSFDLAVSRFSGRRAPERQGADRVTREGYSHEVISAGFWPGTGEMDAGFYSYAAPEPAGLATAPVASRAAFYNKDLKEFLLPYAAMRVTESPRETLLAFCQSVYVAGATLGKWDRANLERPAQAAG